MRQKVEQILGSLSLQRERLYFSKAIIGRGTSMGNFRNAFSLGVGDPFADRPTLVHSRNDGRRPTDSAKTWAHPDTQCEGERVSLPPVSGSSAADSNEMNLCKWQIWRGTKVGRGGEEGLSSSSYLRLSSSQFAHGVRRLPLEMSPTRLSFCLSHSFSH